MTRLPSRLASRLGVMMLLLVLGSCSAVNNAVQEAVGAIDHATDQLHDESTSWQVTLANLENGLDSDAKSLIDNDIQSLINQTVTRAGIETRCEGNFLNDTVAEDLQDIKAKLLKQAPPAGHPEFCQVDPPLINILPQTPTSSLQFAGYNFDSTHPFDVKVHHQDGSETPLPPNSIAMPTTYLTTIGLASSGIGPTDALYIYWNGTLFHTVGVNNVALSVCETKVVDPHLINADPVAMSARIGPWNPPQINGGDQDFDGHGPNITVGAKLTYTPLVVQLSVFMDAKETQSDFTEVSGWSIPPTTIFTAENGYQIDSIESPLTDTVPPYTDHHNGTLANPYPVHRGSGALVNTYWVVGDQDGKDVGRTGVSVNLNVPQIVERQTGNCLSPKALSQAVTSNAFTTADKAVFRNKLTASRLRIPASENPRQR